MYRLPYVGPTDWPSVLRDIHRRAQDYDISGDWPTTDIQALDACGALRCFGARAAAALPRIFSALRRALVECNHPLIDDLLDTLLVAAADPENALAEVFAHESEVRREAEQALARYRSALQNSKPLTT